MTDVVFDCIDAQPDRYAAAPTLLFKMRVAETTGERIHTIALRCQLRIEPVHRRYSDGEAERLGDLFGDPSRWGDTLKPMQFANVAAMVPGFTGSLEFDLPVPCTYDTEVASTRYFHALDEGEIPLLLLFSGTIFSKGSNGFSVEQVPWHKECNYRLPVETWDGLMDLYFPHSVWIRIHRDTLDALQRFKSGRALTTWDHTLESLLVEAES